MSQLCPIGPNYAPLCLINCCYLSLTINSFSNYSHFKAFESTELYNQHTDQDCTLYQIIILDGAQLKQENKITGITSNTGKTPCKYGPVFAPYLHDWTLYGINTMQKWVRIYMAFFLCKAFIYGVATARLIISQIYSYLLLVTTIFSYN